MYGQLVPCGGGPPIPLLKPRMMVGRSPDCDIPIPLVTISSKHCYLEQRGGVWHVNDLASRNGIRIDGVRCQEGQLPPGCVLSIAQQRYQVEYKTVGRETVSSARSITAQPSPSPLAGPARVSDSPAASRTASAPRVITPPVSQPVKQPGIRLADPDEPVAPATGQKTVSETSMPRNSASQRLTAPAATRPPSLSLGELVPCGGGAPIPLLKPSLLVGRSPACDITLEFPMISSKHCQLEFKSGFWHVRDLGSRNGIRVDGIVQLAKFVKPGEILSIAKHRYEIVYTPLADEPPPEENPFALSLLEKAGLAGRGAAAEARFPVAETSAPDDEPVRKKWKIDE